jgi:hypothetical protein
MGIFCFYLANSDIFRIFVYNNFPKKQCGMNINGFNKIYAERHRQLWIQRALFGPSNELFVIVEAKHIVPINTDHNWANDYTMWIRPINGWMETEVFGDWIPVCKIDWELKYIHIAISRVGNGTIVDHIVGARPFEYKDIMDIPNFKKFLSKVLGNCNINQY